LDRVSRRRHVAPSHGALLSFDLALHPLDVRQGGLAFEKVRDPLRLADEPAPMMQTLPTLGRAYQVG
jgi:hypothetical protein